MSQTRKCLAHLAVDGTREWACPECYREALAELAAVDSALESADGRVGGSRAEAIAELVTMLPEPVEAILAARKRTKRTGDLLSRLRGAIDTLTDTGLEDAFADIVAVLEAAARLTESATTRVSRAVRYRNALRRIARGGDDTACEILAIYDPDFDPERAETNWKVCS